MLCHILTIKTKIIRGKRKNLRITLLGHASMGKGNSRINKELKERLSRKRITVSMVYLIPKKLWPNNMSMFSFFPFRNSIHLSI